MSAFISLLIDKSADVLIPKARAAWARLSRHMSPRIRKALLAVAAMAMVGVLAGPSVYLLARVAAAASQIPLQGATAATLRTTAAQMNRRVVSGLMDDASGSERAWSIAQALVAVDGVPPEDLNTALGALVSAVDSQCACWRSSSHRKHPPHIGNTAWSLHALAYSRSTPPVHAVDRLLADQHPSGAWPMHAGSEFGSTHATALSLLALQELVEQDVIDPDRQFLAKRAIDKGHKWLTGWREPKQARWRDYPDSEAGETLTSVSGLVLFTLHKLEREDLTSIDRLWLKSLPSNPPAWDAIDQSRDLRVTGKDGSPDALNFVQWPWLVLGTVSAYPHGNVREQASAARWLDRAVSRSGLDEVHVTLERGAAEFLMAMRALLNDIA